MIIIEVMPKDNKKTSIALSEDTKEQLAQFETKKGESFDIILQRVMTNANKLCNQNLKEDDVATPEDED